MRVVMDLAMALGWEETPMPRWAGARPVPDSRVLATHGIGSSVMLVRRRDRRLIFAVFCRDGTSEPGPERRRFIDQLHSLEWNAAADERAQAVAAVGHSVPAVETFVWRPRDLMDGSIHEALR